MFHAENVDFSVVATDMAFNNSLYEYDAGYYEILEGVFLPGRPVPDSAFTISKKSVDAAVNVELDDSDVLIVTYPRTGQTSTITILHHILHSKDLEAGIDVQLTDLYDQMPIMENEWSTGHVGAEKLSKLEPPRFVKSHLPYQLWKKQFEEHPNLKVIQTIRNPKDTLVSFYHFARSEPQFGSFSGTWDQFFKVFKQKRLPYGDYFEHVAEWYKFNKDRENSLILTFEERKKNSKSHVIKISSFIGHEISDKAADLIVEKSSFKRVSDKFNTMYNKYYPSWNSEKSNFMRKGEVGDWINYFSKEQSDYIDAKYKEYLEPLGIEFEYSI